MIAAGAFRADLYYRLNVLTLKLPALREHPEDIPGLVQMMLERLARKLGRRRTMAPAALLAIQQYAFPGNIRELWNVMERLVVTAGGDVIQSEDLPSDILPEPGPGAPANVMSLRLALDQLETRMIREALARFGTQALAAQHLGITQSTVARKAKRLGLSSRGSC
jgi:transcriptional regulator with PAS, ATPase and Fis domain